MKKKLLVSLIVLTSLALITGCGCKNKKEEKMIAPDFSINTNIASEAEVDGLKIADITLIVNKDGLSEYSAVVTNTTNEVYKLDLLLLTFKDKDNNIIETAFGIIGSSILPSESRNLTFTTNKNLLDAYSIEYKVQK